MEENADKNSQVDISRAHNALAHSYSIYFFLLLFAVFLDLNIHIEMLHSSLMEAIGFVLVALATVLIIWAEATSHHSLSSEGITKEALCQGPYCYTRHPAHWGIFLLMLGFGVLINAFFVILFTIISFILAKTIFLKRHDLVLIEKFGEHYHEYKKSVKL